MGAGLVVEMLGVGGEGREVVRFVAFPGLEDVAGVGVDLLVTRQLELWQHQIGVWIVNRVTGEVAPELIFVVVVKTVGIARVGRFRQTIWGELLGFVQHHQFGLRPWLAWPAHIAPEAGALGKPAAGDPEIAVRFGGDPGFPLQPGDPDLVFAHPVALAGGAGRCGNAGDQGAAGEHQQDEAGYGGCGFQDSGMDQ